jgi:hypothetical protein
MRDAEADEDDAAAPGAIAARNTEAPARDGDGTMPADAVEPPPAVDESGEDPAGAGTGDDSDSKA